MEDIPMNNRVVLTSDGNTLSIPNEVTDTNPSLDMRSLRNSWKALPMKHTFIVHNPLDKHPFLYGPSQKPVKKCLSPNYTRSIRDMEEEMLNAPPTIQPKRIQSKNGGELLTSSLTTSAMKQETIQQLSPQYEYSIAAKRVHFV